MKPSEKIIKVALNVPVNDLFDYVAENEAIQIGQYVKVPFGKRNLIGVVYGFSNSSKIEKNKLRKIIFRDNSGLSIKQKQQIIGQLIGRQKKAQPEDIYEAMLSINDNKEIITISKIATILNVSTRTIYRNITEGLKREKTLLNEEV